MTSKEDVSIAKQSVHCGSASVSAIFETIRKFYRANELQWEVEENTTGIIILKERLDQHKNATVCVLSKGILYTERQYTVLFLENYRTQ